MARIVKAHAWCNNEVAYLIWKADGKIPDCLGFLVTRIHLDSGERRILPAWVAFNTQSNPDWEQQDTSVWPIQKFAWRDLTLRRSRSALTMRQADLRVKYEIRPVGLHGAEKVPASPTAQPGKYKGKPIPLYFCGEAFETNEIVAKSKHGDVWAAFNNGILSTQNLRKQLLTPAGKAPSKAKVTQRISTLGDSLRTFLAGDILPFLRRLFDVANSADGTVYLALYELSDPELISLLETNQKRLHVILCTAGKDTAGKIWDTTNSEARARLRKVLGKRLQDRMFNNTAHIGHNKFAVLVVKDKPIMVLTGSTNWTPTGLCGQTNNTIIIESEPLAQKYLAYWNALHADKQPVPKPLSAPNKANQGTKLRQENETAVSVKLDSAHLEAWFSPNTKTTGSPSTRTVPPDLEVVFDHMKNAKGAIFFLVFNPGRTSPDAGGEDVNTVVSAGIDFAKHEPKLLVMGAISDPTAMPGYVQPPKGAKKPKKGAPKIPLPAIFSPSGAPQVLMIRAAAIKDLIGDFQQELLSAGNAIIHDKVVVIDPLSENDCVVITGSHNLGFKASYANDENMLIIKGNRDLALAYAVHVIDVYDHFRFRAVLEQQRRDAMLSGKKLKVPVGKGFLDTDDSWQDPYIKGTKGKELQYFLE